MYFCSHFFEKANLEQYETYHLHNGLRLIYKHIPNAVAYCGAVVDVGSRDELPTQWGMAHLIEHMLFKGTNKRSASRVINRLEDVGGELNAYTSKEETVVYAGILNEFSERAIELISDVLQHSVFPKQELEKEIEIIKDEIQSYNDSPSELIFDEFEDMLYGSNAMAHNILGTSELLDTFSPKDIQDFYHNTYQNEQMVFFYLGGTESKKIVRWLEKYFSDSYSKKQQERSLPEILPHTKREVKRNSFQVHYLAGSRTFDIYHSDKKKLFLLNNILGGPGMNSLLNISLREKNGLVYQVESTCQMFTDSGYWAVYFGTDNENVEKCERLVKKELQKLQDTKISSAKLKKYKKQLVGQLAIASENIENLALSLGKSYLRFEKVDSLEEMQEEIEAITAEDLRSVAESIFDVNRLTILKYI